MWHRALVGCTPSQSIGLFLGCALFWCWVSVCVPFTISLIEFYFIVNFIMIVVTIMGFLWPFFSFWTTRLGFLLLSTCSSGSANAQLLGCFRPWAFSLNITLNLLPSDSFMSCLHSLHGYSTGEFQAFATDCPCDVWCRGLTTCFLYVDPLLGNLVQMMVGL